MFDERSINLITESTLYTREDYQRTLKILNALVPVIEAAIERLQYEWDKQAKIEIGYNTFVLKEDESGGYVWSQIDPLTDLEWNCEEEGEEFFPTSTVAVAPPPSEQSVSNSTAQPQAQASTTPIQSTAPVETQLQTPAPTPAQTLPPEHIDPEHWHEIVEKSAVNPEIATRNFKSLHRDLVEQANEAWEYLMYSDNLNRRNDGRLRDGDLNRYAHLEAGGWWCNAGVDPRSFLDLQPGQKPPTKLWGCFKPNEPRESTDKPGKVIKYEHPPKTQLSIFLLDVPDDIAEHIYERANVDPSECDKASGFWYCVWKHDIPIIVTEGAKKAASLLSQGHAAIGLPGINASYRTKDEQENPIMPQLREEFAMFATPGRDIKFCFDCDTKPKTIVNVHKALLKTGILLQRAEAKVSVITLPGPDKGVDDFIVNNGGDRFQALVDKAQPLEDWHKNNPLPDLRLTIKLKNGQILNLYEKQADGTVSANPANLSQSQFAAAIPKPPELQQPSPQGQQEKQWEQGCRGAGEIENNLSSARLPPCDGHFHASCFKSGNPPNALAPQRGEPPHGSVLSSALLPCQPLVANQKYWAARQEVPNYAQTLPRKFLVEKENRDIANTAKQLLDNYGVGLDDGSTVYRSDAFTVRKFLDTYSIHRADDEKNSYFSYPLMQFELDKKGKAVITKKPEDMLTVERQEFLKVANFKQAEQLPSFYEDAITLKSQLGSLAPLGTQEVIKEIDIYEVSQLLSNTLKTAKSRHLQIGAYRIKSEINQQTGESFVKLFKKESDDLDREAVKINLTTNEVQVMRIGQQDIGNIRLIAKRVQLEYSQSQPRHQYRQNCKSKDTGMEL
ncbi:hypothetical protein A6770_32360 [Nostoc minutum NIES-26]|uniref:DUF3854 domain-containing protein n=1 Tax=Nostoc minutum NIES-26 TaxID=1844469 RepID=A0A367Q4U9_9NOSO|nr:hypothetical protein A6770_32360 [Nostoc minutum NIES-26]